jgi:hypothetical protein
MSQKSAAYLRVVSYLENLVRPCDEHTNDVYMTIDDGKRMIVRDVTDFNEESIIVQPGHSMRIIFKPKGHQLKITIVHTINITPEGVVCERDARAKKSLDELKTIQTGLVEEMNRTMLSASYVDAPLKVRLAPLCDALDKLMETTQHQCTFELTDVFMLDWLNDDAQFHSCGHNIRLTSRQSHFNPVSRRIVARDLLSVSLQHGEELSDPSISFNACAREIQYALDSSAPIPGDEDPYL